MIMRKGQLSLLACMLLLSAMSAGTAFEYSLTSKGSLSLDQGSYHPNEDIQVSFQAPENYASNAWVGILPSSVAHGSEAENDKYDLSYQYVNERTSGIMTFQAPSELGFYDVRMHDSDDNGREVASVTFTVEIPMGSLRLDKDIFEPGENIEVHFQADEGYPRDAWIGILPSSVAHGSEAENDKYDLAYQYLEKRTSGTMTFQAPQIQGSYDIRMHNTDSNGVEVASVSFSVGVVNGTLSLEKNVFQPGEEIDVIFEASEYYSNDAWVGILPSSVAHGSEAENDKYDLAYQYLDKRSKGNLTFLAPQEPGAYDLRMHDTDDNGLEVAYVTFIVQEAAEPLDGIVGAVGCKWDSFTPDQGAFAAQPGNVLPLRDNDFRAGSYMIFVGPAGEDGLNLPPATWNAFGPYELRGGHKYKALIESPRGESLQFEEDSADLLPYSSPPLGFARVYARNNCVGDMWYAICLQLIEPAEGTGTESNVNPFEENSSNLTTAIFYE
jgi:hypothetical protein